MTGRTFAEYEIRQVVGRGALSVVYRAFDPKLNKDVAIKVIAPEEKMRGPRLDRFLEVAEKASHLEHPNIASVYDSGAIGGHPFLVGEFVEAPDLASLIRKRTFLSFERKLDLVAQTCLGLGHAHSKGIIHGDLRPERIKVSDDGTVKILGFGTQNWPGESLGKTEYFSPEQVEGARVLDPRSDLFSLGVILHVLLTYELPYASSADRERDYGISLPPPSPSAMLSPASSILERIVQTALAPDVESRFPDGQRFAKALFSFQKKLPDEIDRLKSLVVNLRTEMESRWESAQQVAEVPGFFDVSFFKAERIDGDQEDYGVLLRTHGALEDKLKAEPERRRLALEIQRLVATGREQILELDFGGCEETIKSILQLHPEDTLALKLQKNLEVQKRRHTEETIRVTTGWAVAQRAFAEREDAVCLKAISQILSIDPNHADSLDLRDRVASRQTSQLQQVLDRVTQLSRIGEHDLCESLLKDAQRLAPDSIAVKALQEEVSTSLAARDHRISTLLRQARKSERAEEYEEAWQALSQILEIDPVNRESHELRERVVQRQKEQKVTENLLAQAKLCRDSRDLTGCLLKAEEGRALNPRRKEFKDLARAANGELAEARAIETMRLAELIGFAEQEAVEGFPEEALANAEFALLLRPDLEDAIQLYRRVGGIEEWSSVDSPPTAREDLWATAVSWASGAHRAVLKAASGLPRPSSAGLRVSLSRAQRFLKSVRSGLGAGKYDLRASTTQAWKAARRLLPGKPPSARTLIIVAAAGGVALTLGVTVPDWSEPEPVPAVVEPVEPDLQPGRLGLSSTPWAIVESVVSSEGGEPVEVESCTTPCWFSVPAGTYTVKLKSPSHSKLQPALAEIEVVSGEQKRHHIDFPDFELERTVTEELARLQAR